jgi:hypothetical protein
MRRVGVAGSCGDGSAAVEAGATGCWAVAEEEVSDHEAREHAIEVGKADRGRKIAWPA